MTNKISIKNQHHLGFLPRHCSQHSHPYSSENQHHSSTRAKRLHYHQATIYHQTRTEIYHQTRIEIYHQTSISLGKKLPKTRKSCRPTCRSRKHQETATRKPAYFPARLHSEIPFDAIRKPPLPRTARTNWTRAREPS